MCKWTLLDGEQKSGSNGICTLVLLRLKSLMYASWGRRGRDRMVVRSNVVSSNPAHG